MVFETVSSDCSYYLTKFYPGSQLRFNSVSDGIFTTACYKKILANRIMLLILQRSKNKNKKLPNRFNTDFTEEK